jgi:nicotinamidase-related amidase
VNFIKSISQAYLSEIVSPQATQNNSDTAIVVIDMIMEYCYPGGWSDQNQLDYQYCMDCVSPINHLLRWGRSKGHPVIFCNWGISNPSSLPPNQTMLFKVPGKYNVGLEAGGFRKGSSRVKTIKEIQQTPNDITVSKERITGFYETELHEILQSMGIKKILFAGVNLDQCVYHTMADANFRGYECVMVRECCGTGSPPDAVNGTLYNVNELLGKVMTLRETINQ